MTVRNIVNAAAGFVEAAAAGDPQFQNTTLLLSGDGTNGAQNNTFVDSSTNNFTITRNGTPTQGSFSPYGDLWSNQFSGSGQYLKTPSNAAFAYGTGDFTWEMWIYPTASDWTTGNRYMLDHGSNGGTFQYYQNNLRYYNPTVGEGVLAKNAGPVSANTWTHIAVSRASGTTRIFIDGVLKVSASDGHNYGNNVVTVSDYGSGGYAFAGYISNLRIVKGTALYTSNFTPSTTPLTAVSGTSLLTCQSNRFRDNSSNNFAITVTGTPSVQRFSPFAPATEYSTSVIGGSGYFPGSSTISAPNNVALQFGSGDFTIEFWFNSASVTGVKQFLNTSNAGGAPNNSYAIITAGTSILYYLSSTGTSWNVASGVSVGTAVIGTWNHLALVRNGTTITPYLNGVAGTSTTSAASLFAFTSALSIGAVIGGTDSYLGYISNFRIVKGTAVYTSAFTPPTAPLTAITNTSLLLNTVNAGIFDNGMMNDLVTVGDAQVSTSVKKYGTGSMAFDGTGDTLSLPPSPNIELGSGNFTIELWINFISAPSSPIEYLFWQPQNHVSGFKRLQFYIYQNQIAVGYFGTNVALSAALTWNTGQWYHLAVVRNGSSWTIYRDGVSVATGTNTQTLDAASGYSIGASINGYMDDLRITKGIARYTANFTPPTAALPKR